jgi:Arc/MetJ family transcription regulator
MTRKKTTVYIDEALLRAAKVAAARGGKREYEVFEDALRRHLGFAGAVERIWAGISPADAPNEDEAARLAADELAAARAERTPRRTG